MQTIDHIRGKFEKNRLLTTELQNCVRCCVVGHPEIDNIPLLRTCLKPNSSVNWLQEIHAKNIGNWMTVINL
jgi:hypothetical protein